MKILYDYQIFTTQKIGGITRYFIEIINHLPNGLIADIRVKRYRSALLKELQYNNGKPFDLKIKNHFLYWRSLDFIKYLNQIDFTKYMQNHDFDILHPTFYDDYYIGKTNKPVVVTIHDMIHEIVNKKGMVIAKKKNQIFNSNKVIAISQKTKNDVLKLYDIDPSKIAVIYHGGPQGYPVKSPNIWGEYILFVGQREGYKNFERCLNAIARILNENKKLSFICVGPPFNCEEQRSISSLNIVNRVKAIQASDSQLYALYKYAKLFIFPSYYEGFGIPILEAYTYGCPVCISEASCFPEIAEKAAVYFDPFSVDSMYHSLTLLLYNEKLKCEMINKGYERLKFFSWEKASEQTTQIYKSLIQ